MKQRTGLVAQKGTVEKSKRMTPNRAKIVARVVATAAMCRSSDCDLFQSMKSADVTKAELIELVALVPELARSPSYINGYSLLSSYEQHGVAPPPAFSQSVVEKTVREAGDAASRTP